MNVRQEIESLFGKTVVGTDIKDNNVVGRVVGYDTRPIAGGETGDFLVIHVTIPGQQMEERRFIKYPKFKVVPDYYDQGDSHQILPKEIKT